MYGVWGIMDSNLYERWGTDVGVVWQVIEKSCYLLFHAGGQYWLWIQNHHIIALVVPKPIIIFHLILNYFLWERRSEVLQRWCSIILLIVLNWCTTIFPLLFIIRFILLLLFLLGWFHCYDWTRLYPLVLFMLDCWVDRGFTHWNLIGVLVIDCILLSLVASDSGSNSNRCTLPLPIIINFRLHTARDDMIDTVIYYWLGRYWC